MSQGASETLKRKSSAIQGSASRKNPRRDVPSFIPKPDDADLRVPGKLTVEKLRMIMELDMTQFKEMTVRPSDIVRLVYLTGIIELGATPRSSKAYAKR